jgi:hypothetical protein
MPTIEIWTSRIYMYMMLKLGFLKVGGPPPTQWRYYCGCMSGHVSVSQIPDQFYIRTKDVACLRRSAKYFWFLLVKWGSEVGKGEEGAGIFEVLL